MANNTFDKLPDEEIIKYSSYQKKIFFSKVDSRYSPDSFSAYPSDHKEAIKLIMQRKLQKEAEKIVQLPRATMHYVYRVKAHQDEYIIRINKTGGLFRELHFWVEQWVMDKLKSKKLPFLQIYIIDLSRKLVPFDYEIVEKAEGESLYDFRKKRDIPSDLIKQLGIFVGKIHKISTQRFGSFDIRKLRVGKAFGCERSWKRYLKLNLEDHIKKCIAFDILDRNLARQIQEVLAKLDNIHVEQPVLLHGDIAHHNVFTDSKTITALIDWEDCISGDPLYDLAYYATGCFSHQEWFETFLKGYKSVAVLPANFNKYFWVYYIRISLVKALSRRRFVVTSDSSLPDIKSRILYGFKKV